MCGRCAGNAIQEGSTPASTAVAEALQPTARWARSTHGGTFSEVLEAAVGVEAPYTVEQV